MSLPERKIEAYRQAQQGLALILGIHGGHKRHEGHISGTLLETLKSEGIAKQEEETKKLFKKL